MEYALLLFPDFALIVIGWLVCRYTALNRPVWTALERLVYFFLFPVLLFTSIVSTPLNVHTASTLIGAGLSLMVAGITMSYLPAWLPVLRGRIDAREHAACAQVAFRFNSFIGMAVAARVLGDDGMQLIAILIGVCVPLSNVGAVWPMARHGESSFGHEIVHNPLIIATALGLAANLAGLTIPGPLEPVGSRIGATSIPLGLMAAGAGLQLRSLAGNKLLSACMLSVRHFLLPVAAWLLARTWHLNAAETTTLLIFSALPCSSSCYVLASRMGYNGALVAGLITVSTAMAVLSLPWALGVLAAL